MNYVAIFLLDCTELCADDAYWAPFISPLRRKKLDAISHPNAKKLSLGAELALAAALASKNLPCSPPQYYYDADGKPRFCDTDLHFSLSHSEKTAVCAISDTEIGVDIEHPRRVSPGVSRFVLSPDEKDCKHEEILTKWVIKESYLKLTGSGIKPNSMNQITAADNLISDNNGDILAYYHLFDRSLSDSSIISCCSFSKSDAEITSLSADDLKKIIAKNII